MIAAGGRQWFTSAELAELGLPGLSRSKRKINERAAEEGWAIRADAKGVSLARPRKARGGGIEYHLSVLPASARIALIKAGLASDATVSLAPPQPSDSQTPVSRWTWFEAQTAKTKDEAKRRLRVLDSVARLEHAGCTRTLAVAGAASDHAVSKATVWNWIGLVEGVPANDWLPHLAPNRSGGGAEATIDPMVWDIFKSDYLRPEEPGHAASYRLAAAYAEANGIAIPSAKTFQRKLERDVDPRIIVARRKGARALQNMLPPQQRSVDHLHAMELINIDGHLADIFVDWGPDADGKPRIGRPMIVMSQDIRSSKLLTWSIAESENSTATRSMFVQLFKRFGIPKAVLMDNSRTFAGKMFTGGTKNRFRYRVREDEPEGILTALNIQTRFATPYHGQAKPIERAFRDLASAFKHPSLAGAYTGNSPMNKPDNYGAKSIPIETFRTVLGQLVAELNSRSGRRGRGQNGSSFDDVFAASYANAPIGQATAEQLRIAMLTAHDPITTCRKSGAVSIFGNVYHAPELIQLRGHKVIVRFDPDDLHSEVHIYDQKTERFIVTAPVQDAVGFDSAEAARVRGKQRADLRRKTRDLEAAERFLLASEIAALLPVEEADDADFVPSIIRPIIRQRGSAALKTIPQSAPRPDPNSVIDRIGRLKLVI